MTFFSSAGVKAKWVEYAYDGEGRRIGRKVDADGNGTFEVVKRFVYADGNVALVFDDRPGVGSSAHRYFHGPYDELFADEDALGEVLWALSDRQGTVRDLAGYDAATDTTTVVNHRVYDSFGDLVSETDPAKTTLAGYTGQELDSETGLVWYDDGTGGGRWYDAGVGRFLKEDPVGLDEDANLTRYVRNAPYGYVDPTGRSIIKPTAFLPGIVGTIVNAISAVINAVRSFVPTASQLPVVVSRHRWLRRVRCSRAVAFDFPSA